MDNIYKFISDFWESITDSFSNGFDYVVDRALINGLDLVIYLSDFTFTLVKDLIGGLSLEQHLNEYASQLHPTVGYVFDVLNIGIYFQIVVTAHITKFIIRNVVPFFK